MATRRRSSSARKRTSSPGRAPAAQPVPPVIGPGQRLWVLDVPFADRGIASANGARWNAAIRQTVYVGDRLPAGLTPYAAPAFSWPRWIEDDLNAALGPVPAPAHSFTPRPHQVEAIDRIVAAAGAGARGFLLADEVGLGKAQPLDSLVLTPAGFRPMGEIEVGHTVVRPDGRTATVLGVYPQGDRPVYRVTFADGSSVRCDQDHLWPVNTAVRNSRGNTHLIKTTAELAADIRKKNGSSKWYVQPVEGPIELEGGGERPIAPYLLGLLLGDGHFKNSSISLSTADEEIRQAAAALMPEGVRLRRSAQRPCDYFFASTAVGGRNPLRESLQGLELAGKGSEAKFVPDSYLNAPSAVRLAVLQGLMDTDGSITAKERHLEFTSCSERLARDMAWLVRSLGGYARVTPGSEWSTYLGEKKEGRMRYRVSISSLPPDLRPFRLRRKADLYRPPVRPLHRRAIVGIEPVGVEPTQCIRIDSEDHLYITDNFTVTHNTIEAWQAVLDLQSVRSVRSVLVVCPLAVVPHWRRTIADLGAPGLRVVVINYDRLKSLLEVPDSAKAAKRKSTQNRRTARDGESSIDWDVVIFDESHRCRHRDSQRSQAAARVAAYHKPKDQAPFVLWLSATAGQNPTELSYLAPLLAQVTGSRASALKDFGPWLQAQGFHVEHDARFDRWTWTADPREREQDIARMRALLFDRPTPVALRRLPTDIAGWPEITRILLPVDLGPEARRLYEQAWTQFRREMHLARRGNDPSAGMVARLRFRQKASLLRVDGTVEQVEDLLDNGHQVVVSCQFLESLDAIHALLVKGRVPVAVMDGRDPAGREEQRLRFQRGAATVMLFTPVEGFSLHEGELLPDGTNATDAPRSLIVHDPRYSGIEGIQLEGRAHRDGKAANAWYAFCADTVEEDVVRTLLSRVESTKALVGDDTTLLRELESLLDGPPTGSAIGDPDDDDDMEAVSADVSGAASDGAAVVAETASRSSGPGGVAQPAKPGKPGKPGNANAPGGDNGPSTASQSAPRHPSRPRGLGVSHPKDPDTQFDDDALRRGLRGR